MKATGGNQARTFWATADCFIFSQCGHKQPANMTLRVSTHNHHGAGYLATKDFKGKHTQPTEPKSQVTTKTSLKS